MDSGQSCTEPNQTKSFSRESSLASSLSLSRSLPHLFDNDVDCEIVSEAGDIGDRSLRRRHSIGESSRLSAEDLIEQGTDQEQDVMNDFRAYNAASVIKPLSKDITASLLPTKSLVSPEINNQEKEEKWVLPKSLEYISCLFHLAVFGILGVITRYLLQKLFGPNVARVTSDGSILYLDLPSNMVGSFLMGWLGVVFKADIARVSAFLAIGLSTGYLGSLTTFSGWNQKMLDLSVDGQWLDAFLGFLLGLFLTSYSIILGVETAKAPGVWLRWFLARLNGHGLGKDRQHLRWIPFGTLIANGAAACLMASLATIKRSVNTTTCNTIASGIQFGLLGCLSTVSTFMAEFNAMRESDYPWRAYAYACLTIMVSFATGTVIYSVPVWVVDSIR